MRAKVIHLAAEVALMRTSYVNAEMRSKTLGVTRIEFRDCNVLHNTAS